MRKVKYAEKSGSAGYTAVTLEDIIKSIEQMKQGIKKKRDFSYNTLLVCLEELKNLRAQSGSIGENSAVRKIKFTVEGEPVAKARPRLRYGNLGAYTPQKTIDYEELVRTEYIRQVKEYRSKPAFEQNECVKLVVDAYYAIPKNEGKKKILYMLSKIIRPVKKPDWDNVGKIVSDALNKLAFYDDQQIVSATVNKYYSKTPRIEVTLYKLPCFSQKATIKEIEGKM